MKTAVRFALAGLVILGAVAGALLVATDPSLMGSSRREASRVPARRQEAAASPAQSRPAERVPLYSAGFVDDSGFDLATGFMPPDYDASSLTAHRDALRSRGQVAIASYRDQLSQ